MTTEQTDVYFGSGRVTRGLRHLPGSNGGGKPPRKPVGKKRSEHETAEQTAGVGPQVVRARRSQSPESGYESSALSSVGSQTPSLPEGTIPKKAYNSEWGKHYRRKLIKEANSKLDAGQLEKLYVRAGVPTGKSAHAPKSAQELLDSGKALTPSRRMAIRNRMEEEGQDDGWTPEQIQQRIEDSGLGLQKKPIPGGGGATARLKRRQRLEEKGQKEEWTEDQINEAIEKAGAVKRPRGGNKKPLKPAEDWTDKDRYKKREAIRRQGGTEAEIQQRIEEAGVGKIRGVKPAEELGYKGQHSRKTRIRAKGKKAGWTPERINQEIENAGLGNIHQVGQEGPSAHAGSGHEGMGNWVTTPEYQALQQQGNQGYGAENPTAPLSSSSGAIFHMPGLTEGLGNTNEFLTRHNSHSRAASVAHSEHAFAEEGEAPPSPMRSVHSASPSIPIDPALEAYTTAQNAQPHGHRAASPFTLPSISQRYHSPPPQVPVNQTTYGPPSVSPYYNDPESQAASWFNLLADAAERVQPSRLRSTTPPRSMIDSTDSFGNPTRIPNRTPTHYWDPNTGNWETRPSQRRR